MLKLLSTNAGRPVTYETVLRRVWEGRDSGDAGAVRAFVKKLRTKLGDRCEEPGVDSDRTPVSDTACPGRTKRRQTC